MEKASVCLMHLGKRFIDLLNDLRVFLWDDVVMALCRVGALLSKFHISLNVHQWHKVTYWVKHGFVPIYYHYVELRET